MSEWKAYKLGEAPLEIIDGDRGNNYPSQDEFFKNGHCLFLSTRNVRKNGFDFSESQFINKERDDKLRKGKLKRFDTVLTTRGTIGNVGYYEENISFENIRINSGMIIIRPDQEKMNPKYCFYIFRGLYKEFDSFVSGSAQPQLPIKDLNEIEIKLPCLSEQTAIAEVLSSLDDKIDLLHRQNKTLEQIAETLFRQWFVEEAEDWEVGKLSDVIELIYGKTLKEETRSGKGFPVVGSSGIIGYHSEYLVEKPGIVIGRKGTLGKVNYMFENFFPIDTTYYLKSKVNSEGLFYEYFLLKTLNLVEMNSDSAVPGLNRDIALSIEVKIPSAELITDFNNQCSLLFKKINTNSNQIRTLTQLRDKLLPKLINGEVRVKGKK